MVIPGRGVAELFSLLSGREELEKIENGDFDEAGEEDDDLDALAGVVNQINDTNGMHFQIFSILGSGTDER